MNKLIFILFWVVMAIFSNYQHGFSQTACTTTPTSCNLVQNPGFETASTLISFVNPFFVGSVPPWGVAYGSPQVTTGAITGSWSARMWAGSGNEEGIFQNLNTCVEPNRVYWFSCQYIHSSPGDNSTLDAFNVFLSQTGNSNIPGGFATPPILPAINQAVLNDVNIPDNPATIVNAGVCFTANNTYDQIVLYPQEAGTQRWIVFDNIFLSRLAYAGPDVTACCANIGPDCPIPGAVYSWVSFPADPGLVSALPNQVVCPTVTTTYIVTVTSPNGLCTDVDTVVVTPGMNFNLTASPSSICAGSSTTLTASVTGGGGPFTYAWSTGVTGASNSITVTPSVTTTYSVTVTAPSGCSDTESITVNVLASPVPGPSSLCKNAAPFSFLPGPLAPSVTVSYGGNMNGINTSVHQFNPTIATPGMHNFTVTFNYPGGFQCSTSYSIMVLVAPNVTTTLDLTLCVNAPSVQLATQGLLVTNVTAFGFFTPNSPNGTFTASPGPGLIIPPGTGPIMFDPNPGNIGTNNITYTVTANNGCSASATGTITVCPLPVINLTTSNACIPAIISSNVGITPLDCPVTYSWSGPGVTLVESVLPNVTADFAGTYTLTASTSSGCNTTQSITIGSAPNITIVSSDPQPCVGETVTLTANSFGGTYSSYNWTLNGNPISGATSGILSVTTSGTYCVTGITGSCTSNPACINVVFSSPPPVNIIGDNTICQGQNIQLTASIAGSCSSPSIQWLANGVSIPGATSPVLSIPSNTYLAGTIISVTICCNGCCSTTDAATIIGIPTVTLDPVPVIDLCDNNDPVQLNGTSNGTNCVYSGPGVDPMSGLFDPVAAGGEGLYTVTYTCELNGCTNFASQDILVIESDHWHQTTKNTDFRDIGNDVITDAQGNVYITGLYIRKTTFHGGGNTSVDIVSGAGIPNFSFVAKYDACANLMWVAYAVTGASGQPNLGNSITLDESNGYVYAAGNFINEIRYKSGQGDFGASPTIFAFATAPGNNGYVARFRMSDGEALDITPIDLDDNTYATAISANETSGEIYVGGHHNGAANPGQDFLYAYKYLPLPAGSGIGSPVWQIDGLGDGSHKVNDMDYNEADASLWFIGDFKVELLLSSTLITNGTSGSYDAYVARYLDGLTPSLLTLKKGNMTGSGEMTGNGISVDNISGNAFVTGNYLTNTVNNVFENPGQSIPNTSSLNAYFMALDGNGNNIWSQPSFADAGANAVRGKSASYRNGKAYFTGTYGNNATFTGNSLPSILNYDVVGASIMQWHTYAVSFDGLSGNTIWLNATTDPSSNNSFHEGNSIATDNFGHAFITGSYKGTIGYQLLPPPASGNLLSTNVNGVNAFTMRVYLSNGVFKNEMVEEQEPITPQSLKGIKVYPNPASDQFTLEIESWLPEEKYEIWLIGIDGKTVLKKHASASTTIIDLSGMRSGIYFVTVQTGTISNTLKVVKID